MDPRGTEKSGDKIARGSDNGSTETAAQSSITEGVGQAVFDAIDEPVCVFTVGRDGTDLSFSFRRNNPAHESLTGMTAETYREDSLRDIFGDSAGEKLEDVLRECVETGETAEYFERLEYPSGAVASTTRWKPVFEGGEIVRLVSITDAGTNAVADSRSPGRNTEQLRMLFEHAPDEIYVHDAAGNILDVNEAAIEELGYTRTELLSKEIPEIEVGIDEGTLRDEWQSMDARSLSKVEIEGVHRRKDDTTYPVDVWVSRIGTKSSDPDRFMALARDITEQKERERELQTLKERLELAVEGANLGVWDWNMTTDEMEINEQWASILGHAPEEIDPHIDAWKRRIHPEDFGTVQDALDEHLADESSYYDAEYRIQTADGDWKWIRDIGKIVERDSDGVATRAVGIHLDTNERKRYEEALREERDMFAQGPAIVFKWKREDGWPVEYVSENVTDVFGYTPAELESGGRSYADLIHTDDLERVRQEESDKIGRGAEWFDLEPYRIVTAEGDIRWVLEHTKVVREDGEITHLLGYIVDITERREKEMHLRKAQEVGDIGWWRTEIPSNEIYWSERVYEMWAAERGVGTIDHETFLEFIHPDDVGDVEAAWQAALDGEPYDIEHRIITGDGETKWMRETAEVNFDNDGNPVSVIGIVQDITEQKERERKLAQFQEAVEQTAHAVYITDSEGVIEYVNPAFEDITGYSAEESIGQTPRILKSGAYEDAFYEEFWEAIQAGKQWEEEMVDERADGERIVIHQTISPITDDDGNPQKFVAVARDITQRKEYENGLKRAREELRQIIDLVPDLIIAKNRSGEIILANEATADAYGSTTDEIEGMVESEAMPNAGEYGSFRTDDLEAIESDEPVFVPEEELTTADGETLILQTTKLPYQAASGEEAVLAYARDVTELKKYERQLEEQRNNLEMLNQVVRHDIRNDMTVIHGRASLLEEHVDEAGKEDLQAVQKATENAIELTKTARDLSETMLSTEEDIEPVGLTHHLEAPIENARSAFDNTVITVDDRNPNVTVHGNDLLEAVFRNLIQNAVVHNDKAAPKVHISTVLEGGTVTVAVADNGLGIPDSQTEEIFGKGEKSLDSPGTGIGLYLVKTLVDQYGGRVWVEDRTESERSSGNWDESDKGDGSVFYVELPIVDGSQAG